MKIRPIAVGDEESLLAIATDASPGIRPNTLMIYFLATSVLGKYTLALENDNGNVIGFIFAIPDSRGPYLWIHQIAVLKDYRGRGYGEALLNELLCIARREGIQYVDLMVRPDNRARNLYARYQFIELATHDGLGMIHCRATLA